MSERNLTARPSLRVALVAGGLGQGGAEKQLLYMARALVQRGIETRCYCLTRGDHYEAAFAALGVGPVWIGRHSAPPLRVLELVRHLRQFAPQVIQAGHFFANLYAVLAGQLCRAASIGAVRNDGDFELRENPGWGPLLMRWPTLVVANSHAGARVARRHRPHDAVAIVPNVIDLDEFDRVPAGRELRGEHDGPIAVAVGRLVDAKRFERFLSALAAARQVVPGLRGVVIGDGPNRDRLVQHADTLKLHAPTVRFLGARADVPGLLRQADFMVCTSAHEGFPNVVLEAMAARLPVVTTPAGDAAQVILPDSTGTLVPMDDDRALVEAMVRLASDAKRRARMGAAGRKRVEQCYATTGLADQLLAVYARARGETATAPGIALATATMGTKVDAL